MSDSRQPATRAAGVAAGNADTVAAATELLRLGGNAFDAAVAAGFASTVSEPGLASLGGGGFLLAVPVDGPAKLFDFFVDAPGSGRPASAREPHFLPITVRFRGADQVFHAGWGSVGAPGCLDGFLQVHRRLGRLPLAEVVEPARRLARDGAVLDAAQADVLGLLRDIVTMSPDGQAMFAPSGDLVQVGERLRNPQLADFLAELAAGRVDGWAPFGDALEQAMTAGGGAVTAADLAAYQVVSREPLRLELRGSEVLTNPPPSFGGALVADGLAGLAGQPPLDDSPDSYERYVRRLVAISERHLVGPRSVRGTTHVSVVDGDGNVAAMTTSNGSCSGVFVPGTGIQLNNMMGESDLHPEGFHAAAPGTRVGSMMMPSLLRRPDGLLVGLGSGGSERITSALARVLTGLIDRGWSLEQAIRAPRLHWDRRLLQLEPDLDPAVVAELGRHWPVHQWSHRDLYFGGAHAVARDAGGAVTAVGDDRRGGYAEVLALP